MSSQTGNVLATACVKIGKGRRPIYQGGIGFRGRVFKVRPGQARLYLKEPIPVEVILLAVSLDGQATCWVEKKVVEGKTVSVDVTTAYYDGRRVQKGFWLTVVAA